MEAQEQAIETRSLTVAVLWAVRAEPRLFEWPGFRSMHFAVQTPYSISWTIVRTPNPVAPFAANGRPS